MNFTNKLEAEKANQEKRIHQATADLHLLANTNPESLVNLRATFLASLTSNPPLRAAMAEVEPTITCTRGAIIMNLSAYRPFLSSPKEWYYTLMAQAAGIEHPLCSPSSPVRVDCQLDLVWERTLKQGPLVLKAYTWVAVPEKVKEVLRASGNIKASSQEHFYCSL